MSNLDTKGMVTIMGMTSVANILVTRDGISQQEALDRVKECRRRIEEETLPTGDYEVMVDIIADELGLEPDYMFDIL